MHSPVYVAASFGLRWQDVELDVGVLRVRKQVQRVKKSLLNANAFQNVERIGSTGLALVALKSKRSVRSIEMPPYLVTLLGQHKNQNAGAFVFHDEFGNPLDPKLSTNRFTPQRMKPRFRASVRMGFVISAAQYCKSPVRV
jgi:integrase